MMQTQLTSALKQKERLAQLGGAVAKVSHDLRNILTSAQLFTDRIERPRIRWSNAWRQSWSGRSPARCTCAKRRWPLARAEEPAPTLSRVKLAEIVGDVIDSERLAAAIRRQLCRRHSRGHDPARGRRTAVSRDFQSRAQRAAGDHGHGQAGRNQRRRHEDRRRWCITVTDTGPGLPPKAREHLFQPFPGRRAQGRLRAGPGDRRRSGARPRRRADAASDRTRRAPPLYHAAQGDLALDLALN